MTIFHDGFGVDMEHRHRCVSRILDYCEAVVCRAFLFGRQVGVGDLGGIKKKDGQNSAHKHAPNYTRNGSKFAQSIVWKAEFFNADGYWDGYMDGNARTIGSWRSF